MDLHSVTENAISLALSGKTLTMDDYSSIVGTPEEVDEIRRIQIKAGIIK